MTCPEYFKCADNNSKNQTFAFPTSPLHSPMLSETCCTRIIQGSSVTMATRISLWKTEYEHLTSLKIIYKANPVEVYFFELATTCWHGNFYRIKNTNNS